MHKAAKREKTYTGGNFIKECMMQTEIGIRHEKAGLWGTNRLSTVQLCRELVANIVLQINQADKNLLWYYLVLDDLTDLSSTSQHLVFIRGINLDHREFCILLQNARNNKRKIYFLGGAGIFEML